MDLNGNPRSVYMLSYSVCATTIGNKLVCSGFHCPHSSIQYELHCIPLNTKNTLGSEYGHLNFLINVNIDADSAHNITQFIKNEYMSNLTGCNCNTSLQEESANRYVSLICSANYSGPAWYKLLTDAAMDSNFTLVNIILIGSSRR